MNPAVVASLLAHLDREIWLVTARLGDQRGGLIATCVVQASIVPELPRMVIGLSRQHFTCELVEGSGAFALHLLGEEQLDWVWYFGLHSGRGSDKLAGLTLNMGMSGSPLLTGALGWVDCRVESRWPVGDRTFFLGEVLDGALAHTRPALTLKRLVQLAPPDKLQQLKDCRDADMGTEAAAIQTWRKHGGDLGEGPLLW